MLAAGSQQPDFPTPVDQLLLGVAANQAAVVLHHKRSEAALREQSALLHTERELLRVTLASIGDAVIATDTESRVTFLNPVAQDLTGWSEEAQGRHLEAVFRIVHEQTRQPVENSVVKVLRDGRVVGLGNHTVLIARDGTERPIDDSAAPIRGATGETVGVVLIFRDVTERRRAEQEIGRLNRDLQWRVTEFQTLLDVIPIGIAVADDPGCQRIWSNPAMTRLLRLDSGANISLSAPAEERPAYRVFEKGKELPPHDLPMQTAIAAEQEVRGVKHDLLLHDGTWVNLLNYAVPLYDEAGRVRGGLYVGVDITEQERAQQALRVAERRFRAVFNQQFQFMAILAPDGTVLEANDTCFQATGVARERTLGRPFWETPWWDRLPAMQERWKQSIAEAVRSGGPVAGEVDYSMADGSVRHATVVVTGLKDEAGSVTSLIVEGRDDTDRRRAEAALRESEEKLRLLADTIPQLAWMARPDGHIFWYNRRWYEYTGTTPEQMEGWGWQSVHDPDALPKVLERWKGSIASGEPFDMVFPLKGADEQFRSFLTRVNPLKDEQGRILYWFGTNTDISDIKRMEQALRDADRRKDEFLATLAHELRNPLAPLRNAVQILKMPRLDAATVERSREMMERQVHQLVRLVDDLLDVSRVMRGKIELRKEQVELATVVARAVETVQPLMEAQGHDLTVSLPDESLPLDADPVRLAQVVGNLLTNAAKYTEANGRIWLTAQREGNEAVLRVRDSGIGIAPDMLPHIFELFVQVDHAATRSQGGLGIGLTLVKNLVEMHHGTVEAHSAGLGKGSEFVVRLPLSALAREEPEGREVTEQRQVTAFSGHRLLVVDDNTDAADSLAMLLRLQGHEVRVAHDGPSALTLVKGYRPELVFLDIGMPGMDGYEVARRLRQQPGFENVRLAALTGWGQQEDRRKSKEAGFDHHLVKPIEPTALDGLLAHLKPAK
jgi:PAS domain S-box-containing protein